MFYDTLDFMAIQYKAQLQMAWDLPGFQHFCTPRLSALLMLLYCSIILYKTEPACRLPDSVTCPAKF